MPAPGHRVRSCHRKLWNDDPWTELWGCSKWLWGPLGMMICGAGNLKFHAPQISRPTNHHAQKPVFICDISIHPPVFCHKNKGFGRASPNKYPWKLLWHICHKWGFQIRLEKFQKIFLQVPFSLEEYCIAWKSWIKIRNPKKSLIHEGAFWKTICSRVRVEP